MLMWTKTNSYNNYYNYKVGKYIKVNLSDRTAAVNQL